MVPATVPRGNGATPPFIVTIEGLNGENAALLKWENRNEKTAFCGEAKCRLRENVSELLQSLAAAADQQPKQAEH